jgi:hypothetical protein
VGSNKQSSRISVCHSILSFFFFRLGPLSDLSYDLGAVSQSSFLFISEPLHTSSHILFLLMATLSSEYYKPLSCSGCRQQKIRCIALPNQRACQRCLKRGLQCTRPTSRRMPGSLALSDRVKKRKGGREGKP